MPEATESTISPKAPIIGASAVVTGGGHGLGAAAALELADRGAKVAVLDSIFGRAAADAADGRFYPVDTADEARTERAFSDVEASQGPIRILVHAAGIRPAAQLGRGARSFSHMKSFMEANGAATINGFNAAVKRMSRYAPDFYGRRGVIVNVVSVTPRGRFVGALHKSSRDLMERNTARWASACAPYGVHAVAIAPDWSHDAVYDAVTAKAANAPSRGAGPSGAAAGEFARDVCRIVENETWDGSPLNGALVYFAPD